MEPLINKFGYFLLWIWLTPSYLSEPLLCNVETGKILHISPVLIFEELVFRMHWPWDYKGGVLFTKVGLINGKERKCIFSALSIFLFTAMGIYPDVGPFWMRMLKKFSGYMAFVSSSHLMFSSGVRLYLTRHDISLMGDSLYLFILSTHCIYAQLLFRFKYETRFVLK